MKYDFGTPTHEEDFSLNGQVVLRNDTYRYLWSMLHRDVEIDEDVSHTIAF
jgi:hypothetical protein